MRAEEFEQLIEEDLALQPGGAVRAFWTQGGIAHAAPATVLQINRQSVRVRLDGQRGRELTLPRIGDIARWRANCCVRPIAAAAEETHG